MEKEVDYASRKAWSSLDKIESATHQELQTHLTCVCTRDPSPGTPDTATAAEYSHSDTASETRGRGLQIIKDIRRKMSDMQAELLTLREQQRRARQLGPETRIPDHQDASRDADSHI
ncbi:hypothetical protein Tco_0331996 [Tanacetum coccineum]